MSSFNQAGVKEWGHAGSPSPKTNFFYPGERGSECQRYKTTVDLETGSINECLRGSFCKALRRGEVERSKTETNSKKGCAEFTNIRQREVQEGMYVETICRKSKLNYRYQYKIGG